MRADVIVIGSEDAEISAALREVFEAEGIRFELGRGVEAVTRAGQGRTLRLAGGGAASGELLHVFVVMMQAGAPARALVDAECVHPTFAEGLQSLVMRVPCYSLS